MEKREGELVKREGYGYCEYATPYGVVVTYGMKYMVYSNSVPI